MARHDHGAPSSSPRLSPTRWPMRGRTVGDDPLGLRTRRVLRKVLADVARADPAVLSPVRVPVGPVRTPRAIVATAPDVLLPVGHGPRRLDLRPGVETLSGHDEASDEDEEPAQIELVELADLPHQLAVDRHLTRKCT